MVNNKCFGILNKVFPSGPDGLREIVPECFQCPERLPCLKTALSTEQGIEMREKILDRAADNGLVGRLQRWSYKKELSRLTTQGKKKIKRRWWK